MSMQSARQPQELYLPLRCPAGLPNPVHSRTAESDGGHRWAHGRTEGRYPCSHTHGGKLVLVVLPALIAITLPARRAAHLDLGETLRSE
jgi:hypothetical protein